MTETELHNLLDLQKDAILELTTQNEKLEKQLYHQKLDLTKKDAAIT